ncbi:MAG: DUF4270 domain-containing protein [Bacteroidales bacterium]|nr:DUF4270 domain-containing protein [Bacteroidales bacterium]
MRGKFVAFACVLLSLSSCQRNPDSILGNDMHQNGILQARYDTVFRIEAFSVPDDSIILQNASSVLLGTSYSPVFGTTTYNLVVQLLTLRTGDDERYSQGSLDYSHVDSTVLMLPYSKKFPTHRRMDGRPLTLSIYEVEEDLRDGAGFDSAYTSMYQVRYNEVPLTGPVTVYPKPFDTVYDSVSNSVLIAPLKIRLDNKVGEMLLQKVKEMSDDELSDMNAFPDHFRGLYIKVEPCDREEESIVFSVSNLFTFGATLMVYFDGVENGSETKTSYQSFILGPLRFTQVVRDRSKSQDEFYKAQMNGDTASGAQRLYLQASGGSRIRFRIPDFSEVVTGKVVLNQAVLILDDVNADKSPDIGVPDKLTCFKYIDRGHIETLPQETNADGSYNSSRGQYRINITRYLQQILYQGTVDAENYKKFQDYIDIAPSSTERYEDPDCVVLYGPGSSRKPMRMEVTYTVIKDTND